MSLRIVLIAAGLVAIALGALAALAPDMMIQSFQLGTSDVPSRLFARVFGGTLVAVGIMNLLASGDRPSPALRAIVIGNILAHVVGIGVDFTESFPKAGGWFAAFAIHIIFIAAFGYYLLNWNRLTAKA